MKTPKIPVHICRQVLAAVATSLHGLSAGCVFGYSSVLLPQLKEDTSLVYDSQYDSWIASITPLSMALGCAIAGLFIDRFGRRIGLFVLISPFIIGWTTIAFANSVASMLLARALTGIGSGAFRPMTMVYLGELSDPKHRAMFLVTTSLSSNSGVLVSHCIGKYFHRTTAAILFCVPNLVSVVILMFLKESPLWLISKGKFDKGSEFFYWFRTKNEATDKELNAALNKQKDSPQDLNLRDNLKIMFSKAFIWPFMICFVIFTGGQFSGANVINFYATDMIKETFSDSVDDFLIMVLIDSLRIAGAGTLVIIVRYLPRRFIFILCGIITSTSIFCLAAYLYFRSPNLLWFGLMSILVFVYFSMILMAAGWSFISELYPSSVRGLGSASSSSLSFLLLFIAVKITPGIIDNYGIPLYYIICACIVGVTTMLLYFILPETNGKTLQEIEDGISKEKSKEPSAISEQTKV